MSQQGTVDLHCHSTASDGTLAPSELVKLARDSGLSALSLTDHDTVAGIGEAASAARSHGIDFISGIEISAEFPSPGTLHILGYGIDPQNPSLKSLTETLIAGRDNRNPRIIEKLNALGVAVTMQEWQDEAGGGVVGRPHLAAVLLRKGYVTSVKQAFDKYIGQGAPAYADKERLAPRRALELIHESGGLPVLAHPVQLRCSNDAQLELTVKSLVDLGLRGIEVLHSDHTPADIERMNHLADRFSLLRTGGSDFHGGKKPGVSLGRAGNNPIPRSYFDALHAAVFR